MTSAATVLDPATPSESTATRRDPGKRPGRRWRWLLALTLTLLGLWLGSLAFWRYHLKRFQVVREGVFYRVAQPTEFGFRHLIRQHHVATVVSAQLFDFRLHEGWIDPGKANGDLESHYVTSLGARHLQWPMGDEACWPWVTPWQFEQFFKLLDDPANYPVCVHCQGGRHRTGTLAALFRLEYDRWPVEQVLEEMYDFDFGQPVSLQELNLRTYLPRPHPDASTWASLLDNWHRALADASPADYESLVRALRANPGQDAVRRELTRELMENLPFALPLAARLVDSTADPLVPLATQLALACLQRTRGEAADWSASAALVADFGSPTQQAQLLAWLGDEDYAQANPARFDAIVAGTTNRYTPNRLAFLVPLLKCERFHMANGATQFRYCDSAVVRLCAIVDKNLLPADAGTNQERWNQARQAARTWLAEHPDAVKLSTLIPPTGQNAVHTGPAEQIEDLHHRPN